MKICVYFNPGEEKDVFEGKRLRKNIKGALELEQLEHAKDIIDEYDILHLISVHDSLKITYAKEEKIPIVLSAMMCESDKSANVLTYNHELKKYDISPKYLKTINQVNVVLANDNEAKKFLIENGVTAPIEIVSAGVNVSRFVIKDAIETELFRNYFQLLPGSKFIATIGNHKNKKDMATLIELAKLCPEYRFFFFSPRARYNGISAIRRIFKRMPRNIRVVPLLSEEVYCSMMRDASGYIVFANSLPSPITILDSMAAKTPILSFVPQIFNNEILGDDRVYKANSVLEMSNIINNCVNISDQNIINNAYEYAKLHSLHHLSKDLVNVYKKLMGGKRND